jgi:hypothetical protein
MPTLNMDMVDLFTNPEKLKEEMDRLRRKHENEKKAKRDYYHRHRDAISQQRKAKYESKKKQLAEEESRVDG